MAILTFIRYASICHSEEVTVEVYIHFMCSTKCFYKFCFYEVGNRHREAI